MSVLFASLVLGACGGEAEFTASEKREIRSACVKKYADPPGEPESLKFLCDCSATVALEGQDARKYREEPAKFIEQHLDEATIRSCA